MSSVTFPISSRADDDFYTSLLYCYNSQRGAQQRKLSSTSSSFTNRGRIRQPVIYTTSSNSSIATGGVLAPHYTRMRPGLVLLTSTPSLFCFSSPSSFSRSTPLTLVAVSTTTYTSTSSQL
ncbi:hypothetical protein GW17_00061416 [Ensete ventricosum]|nr:hypothetical protein GW17_00061416 [Ensete ventricosum]